jgi:hypothetical protein
MGDVRFARFHEALDPLETAIASWKAIPQATTMTRPTLAFNRLCHRNYLSKYTQWTMAHHLIVDTELHSDAEAGYSGLL